MSEPDAKDLADLQHALVQGWNAKPTLGGDPTWDDLVDILARNVAFLIRHDMQRLLTACYLVDLSEKAVAEAMRGNDTEQSARAVAQLILERELEKLESRKRFAREDAVDISPSGPDVASNRHIEDKDASR